MVLIKKAIRHSVQKNITDSPLGPALLSKRIMGSCGFKVPYILSSFRARADVILDDSRLRAT